MTPSLNKNISIGGGNNIEKAIELGKNYGLPEGWDQTVRYQVLFGFIVCIIILLIYSLLRLIIAFIISIAGNHGLVKIEPYTRLATKSSTYSTNPSKPGAKQLKPSMNEREGIEFTYAMWLNIDKETWDMDSNSDFHVIHKGNKNAYPNRAPGIFVSKKTNALCIYMNTFNDNQIYDEVYVDNIPVEKWFHLAVIVTQPRNLDVYINGFLKKRKILNGIPKQNYGDIYLCQNGGYIGYLSKVYYYDYAITAVTNQKLVNDGPSNKMDAGTKGEAPPYLAPSWWLD
tara:strand:- start:495 stop:1349 length:855 start_codon:yes stop_codon:yes gene_type:complete